MKKGVSEYKMSINLGHSKSYIQSITSGRAMPSISEFLYICEYLGTTPKDFFDNELDNPALLQQAIDGLKALKDADISLILNNINRLQNE